MACPVPGSIRNAASPKKIIKNVMAHHPAFKGVPVARGSPADLTYVARARKALFVRRSASFEKKKKVNCAILAGRSNLMGSISPATACTSRGHRFLFLNVGY